MCDKEPIGNGTARVLDLGGREENNQRRIQGKAEIRSQVSFAKITKPRYSGSFPRERLFRQIDDCLGHPVTWVSAPAGSGKTTLIVSYLSQREIPCIWYRVDEGDEDIATFFYYMGLAAKKTAPQKRRPMPLFTAEYLPGLPTFTLRYFENLYSRLKPPFVIVFDDYQQVPARSALHEIICRGLDTLPDRVHAIILSRESPPPQFARLCASGHIGFMGHEDIRFSFDESREMARMKGLDDLPDTLIRQLHEKTCGWAAGMVLLTESVKRKDVGRQMLAGFTPRKIFEYFASEIFDRTDLEIREFLLKSSFLPGMTVSTARKITGVGRAGEILSRLNREYFFTEKNTEPDPVYRYHPLFREFLISTVKETYTCDELLAIRQKAAGLLLESGRTEDAAALLHDAGDWDGLIRVILDHAQLLLSQGRNKTLDEWISHVPATLADNMPWLLFWKGVGKSPFDPAESLKNLEEAFNIFVSRDDDVGALSAWSVIVSTILLCFDSRKLLDKWINWLDRRVSMGISFPSAEIEANVANSMSAALVWRMPNHPYIKKWLGTALSQLRSAHNGNYLYSNLCVAFYNMFMGRFAECAIIVGEMRKITSDSPLANITLKLAEATVHCSSIDSINLALRSLEEGRAMALRSGVHTLAPAYFWMGMACSMVSGNMSSASELISEYREPANLPYMHSCHVSFFTAWYNIAAGDPQHAVPHAKRAAHLIEALGEPVYEAYARYLLAYVIHETGDCQEAARQLALARDIGSRTGSPLCEYLYYVTDSYMAFRRGDDENGLASLRLALAWGRQSGFSILVAFWRSEILGWLCARALDAGIEAEYTRTLVRKFNLAPEKPPVEIENWPWRVKIYALGKFELILDGIPAGLSGKVQRKPLFLLKALVALGGRDVKEEHLTDLLWPEADGDQAHSAFTSTVLRLRRLIGHDKAIGVSKGRVSLNPMYCWVDVWAFEEMSGRIRARLKGGAGGGNAEAAACEKFMEAAKNALRVYGGPLLPEEGSQPWVLPLRARLRKKFTHLVIGFGAELEASNQREKAAECYQNALDLDEITDEEIYRRLMIFHLQSGRPNMAIEVYRRCRKTLAVALCAKPSPKTDAIYRDITG